MLSYSLFYTRGGGCSLVDRRNAVRVGIHRDGRVALIIKKLSREQCSNRSSNTDTHKTCVLPYW